MKKLLKKAVLLIKKFDFVKNISLLSMISLVIGIIFGILSLIFEKSWIELISVYGFTIFIVPVLFLQIAMSADYDQYGTTSMGKISLVFYLLAFPFADIWFFSGINALYDITPNYHLVRDSILSDLIRVESAKQSLVWVGSIYVSLALIGLLIRFYNKTRKQEEVSVC